jgi:hypothetical protein
MLNKFTNDGDQLTINSSHFTIKWTIIDLPIDTS